MFAVVFIPNFELQAVLRHQDEFQTRPVALVNGDASQSLVTQVTPAARLFGVRSGITSTQAKARCSSISFRLRSSAQEEAAQEILLECAYLSAAYLESTAPGVCTMDLRGLPLLKTETLEESLARWAAELIQRLSALNLVAQVGAAATPELARQAAPGSGSFSFVADPSAFWKQLPIENISPPPDGATVLAKWGIHTVGQFLALGKARIGERLGREGIELFTRAKADRVRPLRLTSPRRQYEEMFEFEVPIETLEPLLFIVRRLLEQLARRIEQVSNSISELRLTLRLESGESQRAALKIASPTRDPNTLFRITHNHLETVRTPSPLAAISIQAIPCESQTQQFQLFETSVRDPNRFFETVGRLGALLGPKRVGTPVLNDSYRPEDFSLTLPRIEDRRSKTELLIENKTSSAKRGMALRRFRPPIPATVRLKNGAPLFLQSAGPNSAIMRAQGPWRASGNWWETLWAREEWDIETKDGALYRIYLEKNEWFIEGAYD